METLFSSWFLPVPIVPWDIALLLVEYQGLAKTACCRLHWIFLFFHWLQFVFLEFDFCCFSSSTKCFLELFLLHWFSYDFLSFLLELLWFYCCFCYCIHLCFLLILLCNALGRFALPFRTDRFRQWFEILRF